ncbi:rhodanese-like domain-containing protein [Geomesophilobacter sediminis]|uniref:ArsR family transcriptional regulator n=1 Tax=Geomesophilobacter sediminis TaxID=2798584 RepID=A0A8J7IP18_9BACT|nr:ArsR family transcriptional regulator [Geomesophilobacter sediminis]MBJ6723964.1 ArsR family transcriptional regulator [Geomesophilobacter sediminis]
MDVTPRIDPQEVQSRIQTGEALLVCAYDDEEKFRALHLEKALSRHQFQEIQPSLPKDKEIVFYCA